MKRILKQILSVMLVAVMVLGAAPLAGFAGLELPEFGGFKKLADSVSEFFGGFQTKAEAATYSGTCGANLTWSLDTSTGVLSITGSGAMTDYTYSSSAPWYNYRSSIKFVSLPDGLTSIGNYAFYYCTSLTSVTIPDSVTIIGYEAFSGCISLTSVTIPDSVTIIGDWAFSGCISLTSITIPYSVTSIGRSAFAGCKRLTSITVDSDNEYYSSNEYGVLFDKGKTVLIQYPIANERTSYSIPDSVTNIDDDAFGWCNSLTSVTIPDSVISIGDCAFEDCDGLASITIPNSVTSIGIFAFQSCDSLVSITISNSVTSIGDGVFAYCTNLASITVPDSVTSIGYEAFYHCTNLTSVTIPDSVTSIGDLAFSGCISLASITIPDSVTSIGEGAFFHCDSLASITIPDSVTGIDDKAFYNTAYYNNTNNWEKGVLYIGKHLIKAKISGSYTIKDGTLTIADWAFESCLSFESVTIPNSVTNIGDFAFRDCTSLASITIPNGVTSIADGAFYNCTSLTSITIPDGVTSIGDNAFYNCTSLASITIPDSVTSIGGSAFSRCDTLTNITIPNSVTSIGDFAFYNCSSLASVTIPDSVTNIADGTFSGCDTLTNITIPDSVTRIGDDAFRDCDGLTSIEIPDSVTSIADGAFSGCTSLTSITIPDGVTSIGDKAFYNCTSLASITIPDSVTSIGEGAFRDCDGLTSIEIPDSVTSIGGSAFSGCTSLTDVYYAGTEAKWNAVSIGSFNGPLLNATIHYEYIPETGGFAEDTNGYTHFGKLNDANYDEITIDNQTYILSDLFMKTGSFSLNFDTDYVLYNLNADNEVEKCWPISGTCYTLTAYDEATQKISVFEDGRLIDSTYDFDISDIVKESVSAQSLETLINKRVRVYEYGGFVYKVMAAETGKGVVTNFDTHHVYIDDVAYELGDREKLSENIQAALFKDAVYTLYDGVVYELMTVSDVCNGLLIDTNIAEVVYNGYSFEYEIRVTNSVSSDFIGDVDGLKNIPELNINLSNIVFALSDKNWQNNNDCNVMLNYTVPDEDKLLVPGETVIVKHPVSMNYDFTCNGMAFAKFIVSAEQKSTPVSKSLCVEFNVVERPVKQNSVSTNKGNVAKAEIQSVLYSRKEDLSLTETMTWHPNIDTFLNPTQKNAIGYAILTTVVMANVSSEDLNDKITDSLLSKIVGNFKEKVGIFSLNIPVTLRVDTEEYGQLIINFVVKGFTLGGDNIANYGNVTYEIIGGDGLKKVPEDKLTGSAGMLVTADIDKFADAVYEVAEAEIEAAYDLAYGNMMNEACEILFAETIVDVMLTTCNQDYKGAFFELITLPAKSATFKCPVDVFVYNENGEICASIKNGNIAVNDDNIVTEVHGGSKKITVYGLNAYQYFFEVIATGNGTMDISIEELSGYNRIMRCLDYYDLPLAAGKKYTTVLDSDFLNTETAVEINSNGMIYLPNADTLYITDISTPIEEYKVNGINVEDFSMKNGKTATITPTIASDENAEYVVLWSVADDSIAEISEKGLVTALKKGTTSITCSVVDSYGNVVVDTCSLNVLPGEFIIKWIIDESITEHSITEGEEINKPNNPTKEGYKFLGWTPSVPATMPAYDLTFTAVWEEIVSNTCPYCNKPFASETECNSHMVNCPSKPVTPPSGGETDVTVVVRNPSTTTISYGDAIILHADVTGTLPAGATIKWESSNSNFAMEVSADGTTCKISPNSKGDTTFTVSVVDVNGNVISSDEQAMTSKAGFFDKIIAFFKKLFGLTKTIPQIYKGIF